MVSTVPLRVVAGVVDSLSDSSQDFLDNLILVQAGLQQIADKAICSEFIRGVPMAETRAKWLISDYARMGLSFDTIDHNEMLRKFQSYCRAFRLKEHETEEIVAAALSKTWRLRHVEKFNAFRNSWDSHLRNVIRSLVLNMWSSRKRRPADFCNSIFHEDDNGKEAVLEISTPGLGLTSEDVATYEEFQELLVDFLGERPGHPYRVATSGKVLGRMKVGDQTHIVNVWRKGQVNWRVSYKKNPGIEFLAPIELFVPYEEGNPELCYTVPGGKIVEEVREISFVELYEIVRFGSNLTILSEKLNAPRRVICNALAELKNLFIEFLGMCPITADRLRNGYAKDSQNPGNISNDSGAFSEIIPWSMGESLVG